MTLMYIEFIERDRTTPIEVFRQLGNQGSNWADGSADKLAFQLGRTMRLGPHPSYIAGWEIPGIERLDAWEEYFHSSAALTNRRSQAMHRAIHIQRAGLYEILLSQPKPETPIFVVEYWELDGQSKPISGLLQRQQQHAPIELQYALERMGSLGPEPPVLAIWGGQSYAAFEPLLKDNKASGMRLKSCGVYRSFGEEVL